MPKIVEAKEVLGVILFGRYLSGPWGHSIPEGQKFELPFDFFVDPSYHDMNLDTKGNVPGCHRYRLNAAGVYADTEDAALRSLLANTAEIDLSAQGRSAYHVSGLRLGEHTILAMSDALAELRGEFVEIPEKGQVSFTLSGPEALGEGVRTAAQQGAYTELLGWASGLWVRDIL